MPEEKHLTKKSSQIFTSLSNLTLLTSLSKKICFVFFLCFSYITFCQTTVTGTAVDKKTATPLPFAYLKIDSVALGTVTDADGKFRIIIPEKYDSNSITFGYIGYENLQLTVVEFKERNGEVFALKPSSIQLSEVILKPKKLPKPKSLLKKVVKKIPSNYSSTPSMINGYYRETTKENGAYIKYSDAVCNYYASPYKNEKYRWRDYQNIADFSASSGAFSFDTNSLHRIHFHHKTLKSEQVHIINSRSSSNLSKRDFHSNIEGGPLSLFARNRVKYQQSFLSKKGSRDFRYKISEEQDEAGNWLYVLDFHTKTTKADLDALESTKNRRQWRLANKRKLLKGKIYINQEDLAVVRYECVVPNELKEYFCGYTFNIIKHFDYKLDVRYKKKGTKYYIDKMRHEDEFIFKDSTDQTTTFYSAISEFNTKEFSSKNEKKLPKDENFANTVFNHLYEFPLEYDSIFWQDYSRKNSLANINSTIRKDMEFEKSLERQFRDKHIRNDSMPEPIAKIEPYSFKIHGENYTDNYAWLKDTMAPKSNKTIMDYLRQENKYAENYNIPLKRAQRNLYKVLVKDVEKNSSSLPVKKNGYSYYSKYSEDDEYPIYYRKGIEKDTLEVELLNVNDLAENKEYYNAGVGAVSPNNQLIAVYENTT